MKEKTGRDAGSMMPKASIFYLSCHIGCPMRGVYILIVLQNSALSLPLLLDACMDAGK
jgi:hypothetical protein